MENLERWNFDRCRQTSGRGRIGHSIGGGEGGGGNDVIMWENASLSPWFLNDDDDGMFLWCVPAQVRAGVD